MKKQDENMVGFLCLWVDDWIVRGFSENFCDWFNAKVSKKIKISDYSDLRWFLGMKNERTSSEIKIRQEKYIETFLKIFEMKDCRPIGKPLEENFTLSKMIVLRRGVRSNLEWAKLISEVW